MSIAITPRVGTNTRRDEDRLGNENNLLLIIYQQHELAAISLAPTDARKALQRAGLITSQRRGSRWLWSLTPEGIRRAMMLKNRSR